MQRIALTTLAVTLAVCGCTPVTPTVELGRLPEPVLATRRRPAPTRPVYPPPPLRPEPTLKRDVRDDDPQSWLPRGGLKRGLWKTIVVHHSASPKATPQSMHNYHLRQRGWANGLGYHFVIGNGVNYPDGQIYVGPRWKRQIPGAHCKTGSGRYFGRACPSGYFNDHGIGICLIGDFEQGAPTPKQLASLRRLIAFLCRHTGIRPEDVHGHGEVTHKTLCPGHRLNMSAVRRSVSAAVAGGRNAAPVTGGR